MTIRTIEKLEDLDGIRKDDLVAIHVTAKVDEINVPFMHPGMVYERFDNGLSIIEQIARGSQPSVAKVDYHWVDGRFVLSVDETFKFSKKESRDYNRILDELSREITQM